jgi:hypothetical protein
MLLRRYRSTMLMEQITRQEQAESSTSNVHIAMPLPAAHEVIKNRWVLILSIYSRLLTLSRSVHTVPSTYSMGSMPRASGTECVSS